MNAQSQLYRTIGLGVFLALFTLIVVIAVHIQAWMKDEQRLPVQVIEFAGDLKFSNITDYEKLIRTRQPGSFFELDVNEVHRIIESQPWVYRASVRKQWPNTLAIYIVEQAPVARWNGSFLLNPYGEVFSGENDIIVLPNLFGPEGSEKTALEGYQAMAELLATRELSIDELWLSERFAWQLQLKNGIELNIGRTEFINRLQRFVDVYPFLISQQRPISYVDLRYDTGLAVGWDSNLNETQEQTQKGKV